MTSTRKNLWALSALLIMNTGNIHAEPFPCPSENEITCTPCTNGKYTCMNTQKQKWTSTFCTQEFSSAPKSYKLVGAFPQEHAKLPRCSYIAYSKPDHQGDSITLNLQNHKVTDKCLIDTTSEKGFVCPAPSSEEIGTP